MNTKGILICLLLFVVTFSIVGVATQTPETRGIIQITEAKQENGVLEICGTITNARKGTELGLLVYNPDGKEIVAKENSVSMLRKTEPEKAYYNCHTDITIPYDELSLIEIIKKDNTTEKIIVDGRFVLPGTEELNEAFMEN